MHGERARSGTEHVHVLGVVERAREAPNGSGGLGGVRDDEGEEHRMQHFYVYGVDHRVPKEQRTRQSVSSVR